jgi:hypothetical protein
MMMPDALMITMPSFYSSSSSRQQQQQAAAAAIQTGNNLK